MTVREKIVNRALECEGKHRSEVGCAGTHDWCAHFVSNVLEYCGIKGVSSTFVGPLRDNMLHSNLFNEPETYPIPSDIISIDWDHIDEPRPLDHVVICVGFDEDTKMITYINGNGSSSTHVTKQQISVNSPHVMYWTRYVGEEETQAALETKPDDVNVDVTIPEIKNGSTGDAVKSMQTLLIHKFGIELPKYGADGDFGAETYSALVKFQKSKSLDVDGVCGKETWSALIN